MGELLRACIEGLDSSDNPMVPQLNELWDEMESLSGDDFWEGVANHFLLDEGHCYLNTATIGMVPAFVHLVVELLRDSVQAQPFTLFTVRDVARESYRELQDTLRSDTPLGYAVNFSSGMDVIMSSLRLTASDAIVVAGEEYSPVLWELRRYGESHGVHIHEIGTPVLATSSTELLDAYRDGIAQACQRRPAGGRVLVFASHVQNSPGFRQPIAEIARVAREADCLTMIDGSQALGHIDVDLRALDVDFYLATLAKWAMAPVGTGVVYAGLRGRRAMGASASEPIGVRGFLDYFSLTGVGLAFEFIRRIGGVPALEERLWSLGHDLRKHLEDSGSCELVTPREPLDTLPHARLTTGGITTIRWRDTGTNAGHDMREFHKSGFLIGSWPYGTESLTSQDMPAGWQYGRIAPHLATMREDLEQFVGFFSDAIA